MKIGVLTFHFVYNYGAMLQAYALSHYLNGMKGTLCEVIDYRPRAIDSLYHPDWRDLCSHPGTVLRNGIRKKKSQADFTEFESFSDSCFRLSKRIKNDAEFKSVLDQYDVVFVGSDQVWNPMITGYDKNYLLWNTKEGLRKFSYAASIGSNKVDEKWRKILEILSEFEKISVRERSAYDLVKELVPGKDVWNIADPVFLFCADRWRKIEKKVDGISGYLLYYSLQKSEELEEKALEISKRQGLKIVSVHPLYKNGVGECRCNIGPAQFLWLIDHAEYVCTDSFHATAFSAILSRRTIVQYDTQKGNRIRSLLGMLGERPEEDNGEISTYSFQYITSELEVIRCKGEEFIRACLGGKV